MAPSEGLHLTSCSSCYDIQKAGEEFFWQLKGDLTLDVVWRGKFKRVVVPEGHCFLLPSHVPHSPKRPALSVGVVVERGHEHAPNEIDRVRWYAGPHTEGTWAAADDSGLPHETPGHARILYGARNA